MVSLTNKAPKAGAQQIASDDIAVSTSVRRRVATVPWPFPQTLRIKNV